MRASRRASAPWRWRGRRPIERLTSEEGAGDGARGGLDADDIDARAQALGSDTHTRGIIDLNAFCGDARHDHTATVEIDGYALVARDAVNARERRGVECHRTLVGAYGGGRNSMSRH